MMHDDLWSFALSCYAQPGVETACLELQAAGADVCLLLTGAWLEYRGIACNNARIQQLRSISDEWQPLVVVPLRNLRQAWRQPSTLDGALAALRMRIKQMELDAERVQLKRLQSAAQHWKAEPEQPADWLLRLCADLEGVSDGTLQTLRRAAAS